MYLNPSITIPVSPHAPTPHWSAVTDGPPWPETAFNELVALFRRQQQLNERLRILYTGISQRPARERRRIHRLSDKIVSQREAIGDQCHNLRKANGGYWPPTQQHTGHEK